LTRCAKPGSFSDLIALSAQDFACFKSKAGSAKAAATLPPHGARHTNAAAANSKVLVKHAGQAG
jgi:hypothetical protein